MQNISPQQNAHQNPKPLFQARGILRAKHYSLQTEQTLAYEKKLKNLLLHKNRFIRLDRKHIGAARGSVQPVFYPALRVRFLRQCVVFRPICDHCFLRLFPGSSLDKILDAMCNKSNNTTTKYYRRISWVPSI